MASNPYVNKVQLANGTTLIDLTGDTVTADKILYGYTAHTATGAQVTGTAVAAQLVYTVGSYWSTTDSTKDPATELGFGTWLKVSPVQPTWARLKETSTWANVEIDNPVIYTWRRTA